MGEAAASLFAALFPSECSICNAPLTNISRLPVCPDCLSDVSPTPGPVCSICSQTLVLPNEINDREARCSDCMQENPLFTRAVSYGSYEGVLRELVHLLKYRHVHPAAKQLGAWVAEVAAPMFASDADPVLVIPVPLHSAKFRERGFNQSELTARAALRQLSRVCPAKFELNFRLLIRKRRTESQVGMTREQRRANLRGAFAATRKEAVRGRRVLLIDDVFTTGATVSECSRVLLAAGASEVKVATAARTLRPSAATYSYSINPGGDAVDFVNGTMEGAAPGTAHS